MEPDRVPEKYRQFVIEKKTYGVYFDRFGVDTNENTL